MTRLLHVGVGDPGVGEVGFPLDAVTEAFAYLGVRGSGKSNLARVVAEEMFKAKIPFVAVDPVGSWYGLRSNRDGTGPGLPVPIFGGEHGDWPLEKGAGPEVADMIVGENLSGVVDTSRFEDEEDRRAFLLAFARRLYYRNRTPRHLFLEEADDYLPQTGSGKLIDDLIRAFVTIVRRGRQRGLGVTMITQRSAALSKDVLSQAGTLVAFRLTSPHDRESIRKWLKDNTDAEAALAERLPTLENGEAILWSPNFLRVTRRVRFRLCWTYDSGRTATMGTAALPPATLADIDVPAMGKRLAAAVARAAEEDPAQLRARVRELETKLSAKGVAAAAASARSTIDNVAVELVAKRMETSRDLVVAEIDRAHGYARDFGERVEAALQALGRATTDLAALTGDVADLRRICDGSRETVPFVPREHLRPFSAETQKTRPDPASQPSSVLDTTPPTPSERKVIDAIAWWARLARESPNRGAAAWRAGYSGGGGRFGRLLASLRRKGLIEYYPDEGVGLAGQGPGYVSLDVDEPNVHDTVLGLLTPSEGKLFSVLWRRGSLPFSTLADEAGYSSDAGRFGRLRAAMRRYGILHYPRDGWAELAPALRALSGVRNG